MPVREATRNAREGWRVARILRSSSEIRSRLTLASEGSAGGMPASVSGSRSNSRTAAHGAHHAEAVLGEPIDGRADRAEPPRRDVRATAERIVELAGRRVVRHRVDDEIAAREILDERHAEHDMIGTPRVGVGALTAERGHLDVAVLAAPGHDRHGAVREAGGHGVAEQREHLIGMRARRDVPVARRAAEQCIADRAADGHGLVAGGGERRADRADVRGHGRGEQRLRLLIGHVVTPSPRSSGHSVAAAPRSRLKMSTARPRSFCASAVWPLASLRAARPW